ncbi:MAG: hypothetical protein AB2417_18170 [Clostridiaceae bacterium]
MIVKERNFYIIKRSNGVIWNFFYYKNIGIVYRILIDDQWSSYNILAKGYGDNFHIILLPNDNIYILYKDFIGNLTLKIHDGLKWSKEKIIQNFQNPMFDVDFKAVAIKNEVHIVYSILNKKSNNVTFFHQKIEDSINLSNARIIDIVNSIHKISFHLRVSEKDDLFIIYEKLMNSYELGYRMLNKENSRWSNFYIIDRSKESFIDYSFLPINNILYILAIKKYEKLNGLFYYEGNLSKFSCNKVFEGNNLNSCSLCLVEESPFGSWVNDNNIYHSFFINIGKSLITPLYCEGLSCLQLLKAMYISNSSQTEKPLNLYEIYLRHEDDLLFLIDCDNYSPILNKNLINYIKENYRSFIHYAKTLNEKEQLIASLNSELRNEETKNLSQTNTLNIIREDFKLLKDNRKLLNESINSLKESLISKEGKIIVLENIKMENENRINLLNEEIKKLQEKIDILNSPLKSFLTEKILNNLK